MTKDDLQKELKEKVKEGVKPSHLKRSRSLNDLSDNSELVSLQKETELLKSQNQELKKKIQELEKVQEDREIFVNAPEENAEELKTKIGQLEDQIIELRISKLKDFGEYLAKKKELKAELESNVNYGAKEIERLENKLRTINKKKLELQDQLSQTQSKNARLELRLIDEQNKETSRSPNSNFWTNYGPTILLLSLTALSIWLLKNPNKYNQ